MPVSGGVVGGVPGGIPGGQLGGVIGGIVNATSDVASVPKRLGKVDFGGIGKDINLAYTPEAEVGKYVLVHVGFAISVIDEAEAKRVFQFLEEPGGLKEDLGEIPR